MADEDDNKTPAPGSTVPSNTDVVYNWTDISKEFFASCGDLKLGELMHDSK